jgi:hypothetical protein
MSITTRYITSTYTQSTSHIGLIKVPSTAYIISAVLISIISIILMYFCISDNSRHVMIKLYWWFCFFLAKIVMLVPSILVLLYCYIYKSCLFISAKYKNRQQIDVVLHDIVVVNNTDVSTDTTTDVSTDVTTDVTTDKITHIINYILKCYSWSGLLYPFSEDSH